jgi:UDP-N-acetylmuramoylalanine--D-glutamate ligase
MAPQRATQARFFSCQTIPEGIEAAWFTKVQLFVRPQCEGEAWTVNLAQMRMRGSLNKENLAAAVLATLPLGATKEAVEKVVLTHSALPGRLEFVKRLNSVAFYDDSHGVNVQSVLRSLQAFIEPVILISGGRDKNQDYTPLIPHIRQRVKNLILVGEAKEKMNRAIGDYTETFLVGTVEEAVILAYQKSRSGDVILLSPGCAPSDAFASNNDKGQYFKKLVAQIAAPRRPTVF